MKIPLLFIAALLSLVTTPASFAVSASGTEAEYLQPDGQAIRLLNAGDEWFNWHETSDGYTVSKDTDGFWKYAQPQGTKAELMPLTQAVVGKTEPASLGLKKRNLPSKALVRNHIRSLKGIAPQSQLRPDAGTVTNTPSSHPAPPGISADTPAGPPPSTVEPPVANAPTGPWGRTIKPVIILACFSDHWNNNGNTAQVSKGRVRTDYVDLFNKVGYNASGAKGSVKDFYLQNSYGELTLESTVTVWVRLPQTQAWYGDNANEVYGEQRSKRLALDAINAADAAGFDFSTFDGDGDGYVDLLHIIYSGHSESWGGNPSTAVWPRQWQLNESVTRDSVKLSRFSMSAAIRGAYDTSTTICTIGTICHEIGHLFGLPDLYDTTGLHQGIGTWCCMGHGAWGATNLGDGSRPVNFSAHCRHMMGFIKPTVLYTTGNVSLPYINENPVAHMIVPMSASSTSPNEYFLIENRRRVGFDLELPGDGILIWHILTTEWDNDYYESIHPAVRLEEATGSDTLLSSRYALATHLWHRTNGLSGGFTDTTGNLNTNAMKYQAGDYYARYNIAASHSKIRVRNFSTAAAVMTYDVQTVVPKVASLSTTSASYSVNWSASSDASTYQLQEGLEGINKHFVDEAESETDFRRWWSTTGLVLRSNYDGYSGLHSYRMASWDDDSFNYMSEPHSMHLNQEFVITPETLISFHILSHVANNTGHLSVELSKDDGSNWVSIDKLAGYMNSWTARVYSFQSLATKGFVSGDRCRLRFVTRIGEVWGWSGYPSYGFALDSIRLGGVEMSGFHSWLNVGTSSATTQAITNIRPGRYAYRVRAMVGQAWQSYSDPEVIERLPTAYEAWASTLPLDQQGMTDDADQDGVINGLEYAFGRQAGSNIAPHDSTQLPVVGSGVHTGTQRLTLMFELPTTPPTGTVYQVQVANDLSNTWSTILTKNGTANWTGSAPVTVTPQAGQRTRHTVFDLINMQSTTQPRRFMRLKVSLQP